MSRLHTCSDCGCMTAHPICDDCQHERKERHKLRHPSNQPTANPPDTANG